MPKVTVAIPCLNHGAFLPETLNSVKAQTFADYEIIIIDDGSTDKETIDFLNAIKQSNIRIISTSNRGVSAARNLAIANASGQYILPLDADDKIAPSYLDKSVAVLDANPEITLVYSDQVMFGEKEGLLILPPYDQRRLLVKNLIHASAVFRRSLWEKAGGYSERMNRGWEDWAFWIAVWAYDYEVFKIDEPLFFYRVRSTSRDNIMTLSSKMSMYGIMAWQNRALYSKNLAFIFKSLFVHALFGMRRA